jgi:hypothetical protein
MPTPRSNFDPVTPVILVQVWYQTLDFVPDVFGGSWPQGLFQEKLFHDTRSP